VSGSQVTVNLTGVTNVQRITVTLFNVNDGTHMGNVPVSMGVLVGDVNGNAVVNASDVSLTKSQVGQAVSGSNFREDVNANGTISATDVALVKSDVGTALPP
jgi:dockerin type I repeat protein